MHGESQKMCQKQVESAHVEEKRTSEKQMVFWMIRSYCRRHHGSQDHLCPNCESLLQYAVARVERCPRMAEKTFCSACATPCYNAAMSRRIRRIMADSGPRMLFHRPLAVIRHALLSVRTPPRKESR